MRGQPAHKDIEKHLFVSDFQIPEQDDLSINAVLNFIPDLKPDFVHFVGDILDLTKLSRFDPDPYDKHNFNDEIQIARVILKQFTDTARKANQKCQFTFESGNHELRALNILIKNPQLLDLEVDGENIVSLPHLLELKKLGIQWIPYYKEYLIHSQVLVEHGDIARQHGGYTAKAMLDRRGMSGFSGHTHRLALHMVTKSGHTQFWVETGCLCKTYFRYPYAKATNWQSGFAVGIWDKEERKMHPCVIPIFNHSFYYGDKQYTP